MEQQKEEREEQAGRQDADPERAEGALLVLASREGQAAASRFAESQGKSSLLSPETRRPRF